MSFAVRKARRRRDYEAFIKGKTNGRVPSILRTRTNLRTGDCYVVNPTTGREEKFERKLTLFGGVRYELKK